MFTNSSIKKFKRLIINDMSKSKNKSNKHTIHKFGINLTELGIGKSAKVRELHGNPVLTEKLKAMGIIPNAIIIKKSTISVGGPIVVEKGFMQFAIGYNMGQNIIVDPIQQKDI